MKEKLVPSEPRLKGMDQVLTLLESEEMPDGGIVNWKQLAERVKPYHSMFEFTENIRETVREYVAAKFPGVKKDIGAFKELGDKQLLDALTMGWFEGVEEEVSGKRREVLLAVAAHIVKRIETKAERELLSKATPAQLQELDIDPAIRDLTVDLLDASAKADPLFVRFLAYSQLSGEPPEEATPTGMHMPGSEGLHTIAELFPHETQFIAKRYEGIANKGGSWSNMPGGEIFAEYLRALARYYSSTDTKGSAKTFKEAEQKYAELLATDFPVMLTMPTEGYFKEPYLDPELKISISNRETKGEEASFRQARDLVADSLAELGMGRFSSDIKNSDIKSGIVLGGFGVNLTFNAVAQEKPGYVLFLNEQIRTYDRDFVKFSEMITGADKAFENISPEERGVYIEHLSRTTTMLHEFGHPVYGDDSPESNRLGRKPLTIIDEIKAEALWRSLMPYLQKEGLPGSREQWAIAMLVSAGMMLKDQPEDDPYFSAAVFALNDLFARGAVVFNDKKITITNIDAFYEIVKPLGPEVLALYGDEGMAERKAVGWIKERCTPSPKLKKFIQFAKKWQQ